MRIVNKNKRAFTLVEVMTAIAIIILISGLFVSLIVAVKDSFYRAYNSNDSEDYAAIYAQALENYILKDASSGAGSHTYKISTTDSLFYHDGTALKMNQMINNQTGLIKWKIYMDASYNQATGVLQYTLYFVDNYYDPNSPLVLTYEGSVWIPCHTGHAAPAVTINRSNAAPAGVSPTAVPTTDPSVTPTTGFNPNSFNSSGYVTSITITYS